MLNGKDFAGALKTEIAVSPDMQAAIDEWGMMFKGRSDYLESGAKGLNLGGSIAAEIARLVTVEMESRVSGGEKGEIIDAAYQRLLEQLRVQLEFAAACGGMAIKPYVKDGEIYADFVRAGRFYPTAFNGRGEISGAVFVDRLVKGKKYYTRLEYHELAKDGYHIRNKAFLSLNPAVLGAAAPLASVDEWEGLHSELVLKRFDSSPPEQPLFVYFKMSFANHIDEDSPLGVSVYSRAVELIKQADMQYNRILWEFEGSELAIDASAGALRTPGIKKFFGQDERPKLEMPKRRQRLFRELGISTGDGGDLYSVFSPEIRDVSLFNGLNKLLKRIEFACYLSYGTLSEPQEIEKTAEEIKMSRQRSFSAVCDIQKSLQQALEKLVQVMGVYGELYGIATGEEKLDVAFNWGDSITVDGEKDRENMRRDYQLGLISAWEYREKFYGESEEEAKMAVKGILSKND